MRSSGKDGRDADRPVPRRSGFEATLADALVARLVESRIGEALMDRVLLALMESRNLDRLVVHLLARPDVSRAVDELVDRQVGRVLRDLEDSEELERLVREQVDASLAHLNEHPERVQQLLQDQSRGMAQELQATVRATALSADDAVDAWVRRVLRRP